MLTPSGIGTTPSLGTIGGLGSESEARGREGSSESSDESAPARLVRQTPEGPAAGLLLRRVLASERKWTSGAEDRENEALFAT